MIDTTSQPLARAVAKDSVPEGSRSSRPLDGVLWIIQGLLGAMFVGTSVWKLTTPLPELAAKMPWMGEVSPSFVYATAVLDLLGGLGVLLPSLTRVRPQLTVLAALGCVALMIGAILFHISRGELANTPFNFLVAALSAFVAWGRHGRGAIAARA
ncbi:MAG TPA: DoxX family protein [Polyangiaceae bacterium]|nr:DoxX family protein [Polyangiaceae bacterium]